jgi:hypothetical protein
VLRYIPLREFEINPKIIDIISYLMAILFLDLIKEFSIKLFDLNY